jgi:hypothetical protein
MTLDKIKENGLLNLEVASSLTPSAVTLPQYPCYGGFKVLARADI